MSDELRTSSDGPMTADKGELVGVDNQNKSLAVDNQREVVDVDNQNESLAVDNQREVVAVDDRRGLGAVNEGELVAGSEQAELVAVKNRSRNQALVSFVLLPMLFLTVTLLGGLRVNAADGAFVFVPPPLITLVLAVLLLLLFVRGRLIELREWVAHHYSPLTNVAYVWTLVTLFFASAQAFNSVLPERGLLHWLFSFFFLWTLWNNQFSSFDARRLLRSLVVLFGTAFVLKHMLLASLYASDGGWLKSLAGALLQGVSLGTLDAPAFAPATGYVAFFTLALYIVGLLLISREQ